MESNDAAIEVDSLGFACPEDLDKEAYVNFWNDYLPILARRERRWLKVGLPRAQKLKRFVRKGVPAKLRATIWMLGCPQIELAKYEVSKTVIDAIRLDLPRTFPDNERLSSAAGKRIIGRILFRVAQHFPDIGYCQGFNFIAALLYLILNDENATVRLMTHSILQRRNYYTADMSGIVIDIKVLRDLLRDRKVIPSTLLRLIETDMEMMLSKWLLCWFLETLPMESVLRIWDCLFVEGDAVLFRVAVTLIEASVPSLVKCRTLSEVLQVFRDIGTSHLALNCHHLLQASALSFSTKEILAFATDKASITQSKLDEYRCRYTVGSH
ncbi:Growth hormone-regulated TBC protein 6 [Toxocara canis]|uniref:Growth hormone-regulated TBC protein 6 n=1 Tax=Toxocara canis TaxID=6265 RepID=A0A0B2VP05_TOXCA|nr:Growth hormone-regulated TBC protein 6 [Toxocara canis]